MSSSSVSITAIPSAASLRRPLLTADKKSASTEPPPVGEGETDDILHSIRPVTETALATSADALQTRNSTKLRKRTLTKKGAAASSSPLKTAVSVILKNLSLVVILLLLAQTIRRLAVNQGVGVDSVVTTPNSDHERQRIEQVDKLLKSTTRMMQVQVEAVDRKIENEIAGLKSELGKRTDGAHAELFNRLSEFHARIQSMEKSLTSTEWLSKDEFRKFMEDFKSKKKADDDTGELKLDEIRAFAREIVEKEIGKHAADGLGRVDYAVASGGAKVLNHSEAFNAGSRRFSRWFNGNKQSDAVKMLQPSFGQPGECFPLKGDSGFVEIKLRTAIVPEAISLEHVSKSVAFDRSSAPKDCKVWVWGWLRKEGAQNEHLLTEFKYDLEKSSAQTFNVLMDTKGVIDTVRLQFMSNHGCPTHTCIYRVRVHGHQPNVS